MLPAVVRLIDQAGYSALVRHIKSGALSIVLSDLSFELLGASPVGSSPESVATFGHLHNRI
jgi:hypothetical protein